MPEHTPAPTPSRGVYGFALHLTIKSLFIIYILWAIIPENVLHSIGITNLPQRYWAIAIPIFLLTCLAIFAFIIYPSLCLCMSANIDDMHTITDKAAKYSTIDYTIPQHREENCQCINANLCGKKEFDLISQEDFIKNSIPTIQDLKMTHVSEYLYL